MAKKSKGKVVITGGSSGIGAGFAKAFAKKGYDLVLISRDKAELTAFERHLKALFSVNITTILCDLSQKDELKKLENKIAKITDLEILVNCAGYGINHDFLEEEVQKREDMVMVHDIATMRLTYQAIKIMKKRKRGNIINISSLAALLQLGNNPVYAASKEFINSFSHNLYRIYKDTDVYVQSLCPGFTATNFAKKGGYSFRGKSMRVEDVVKASLSCMRKKKALCIPGWRNRLTINIYRILPRVRSNKIFKRLIH